MRKVTLVLVCFLINITLFAKDPVKKGENSNACVFSGKVLDKSNLEALTGAEVEIKELEKSTYVSFDGTFAFNDLPKGTYTVVVKYIGYVDQTFEMVQIAPNEGVYSFRLSSY